jgi:hypothetical protein
MVDHFSILRPFPKMGNLITTPFSASHIPTDGPVPFGADSGVAVAATRLTNRVESGDPASKSILKETHHTGTFQIDGAVLPCNTGEPGKWGSLKP